MNCRTAQRQIQLELDGDLSPERRTALADHLAGCERCRSIHSQLHQIRTAMGQLAAAAETTESPTASIDFGRPRVIAWRPVLAVAAVVALCFGGWFTLRSLQPAPPQPTVFVQRTIETTETPAPQPKPRVHVVADSDVIVVPHETANPDVTIIWLYETVKTTRARPQPDTEAPASS